MPWGDAIGGLIEALAPLLELFGVTVDGGREKKYITRWPKVVLPILAIVAVAVCVMAC